MKKKSARQASQISRKGGEQLPATNHVCDPVMSGKHTETAQSWKKWAKTLSCVI